MRVPWLSDVLRASGQQVVEVAGWQGRGKALSAVRGVVWHHTATGRNWSDKNVAVLLRDGRSDLPGPLSQLGLSRDGVWWVIADGKGNHNGRGTWGNSSIGVEAFNDGRGEPWPAAQLSAWVIGTAAILRRLGFADAAMLGHRETDPNRKIDPSGVDLAAARGRISQLLAAPFKEADVEAQFVLVLYAAYFGRTPDKPGWDPQGFNYWLAKLTKGELSREALRGEFEKLAKLAKV